MKAPGTHVRLGMMRRGHPFSNVMTLHPVQEIGISDDGLAITVRAWHVLRRRYRFTWDEVQEIVVERSSSYKGIGYTAVAVTLRKVTIRAGGRSFSFDASQSHPDFAHGPAIARELERHFRVTHLDKRD